MSQIILSAMWDAESDMGQPWPPQSAGSWKVPRQSDKTAAQPLVGQTQSGRYLVGCTVQIHPIRNQRQLCCQDAVHLQFWTVVKSVCPLSPSVNFSTRVR